MRSVDREIGERYGIRQQRDGEGWAWGSLFALATGAFLMLGLPRLWEPARSEATRYLAGFLWLLSPASR